MPSSNKVDRFLIGAIVATAVAIVAVVTVVLIQTSTTKSVSTSGAGALTGPTAGATTGGTQTTTTATTIAPAPPHFDTPEGAMIYLASAWNRGDSVELDHVTNPAARAELSAMHSEATNLRLNHCEMRPGIGDYICYFDHDYPAGTSTTLPGGVGHAAFLVGPARTPGWYMTVFQYCG